MGVVGLLRLLPEGWAIAVGKWLGRLAFRFMSRYRERSIINIRAAFPGAAPGWVGNVARGSMEDLGASLALALRMAGLEAKELVSRTRVVRAEHLERVLLSGLGTVVISAHTGCWEHLPAYLAALGKRVSVVAVPQAGLLETRLLRGERARLGVTEIGGDIRSLREAVRMLSAGGVVVCPFDRCAGRDGFAMELLGRSVSLPSLGLRLSQMTQSWVLAVHASRSATGPVLAFEPAFMIGPGAELPEVAAGLAGSVERWIREDPKQRMWLD